jgi:glycosyltransferase involved in cell wall biosynthesis
VPRPAQNRKIRVFVHLAYGFDAHRWEERWVNGKLIGINERFPYGYHRAEELGCEVKYSRDQAERQIARFFRLAVRFVLGFDLVHAWRNRRTIRDSEVIWTHTESQHLAVSLLLSAIPKNRRPKIIAQSVWVFDRWSRFSFLKKRLYLKLMRQADVLTFHSPNNLEIARRLLPATRSELVLFGIAAENMAQFKHSAPHVPFRIISLGNDEHRDWTTLIQAVKGEVGLDLRIASHSISPKTAVGAENVTILNPKANSELLELYDSADLLVVALKPNLHASGITVIQEAVLRGIPVVCSDVGGLRTYFEEGEVRYVRPQDPAALRRAIEELACDDAARWALVRRGQARLGPEGLSSQSYVRKHAELSKELVFGAVEQSGGPDDSNRTHDNDNKARRDSVAS